MSFTGISGPNVNVDTPDRSLLNLRAEPGTGVIPTALGIWGARSDGTAYFDAAGTSAGELAALGYDVNGAGSGVGCLFLETATDPQVLRARLSRPSDGVDEPVHAMPPVHATGVVLWAAAEPAMPPVHADGVVIWSAPEPASRPVHGEGVVLWEPPAAAMPPLR